MQPAHFKSLRLFFVHEHVGIVIQIGTSTRTVGFSRVAGPTTSIVHAHCIYRTFRHAAPWRLSVIANRSRFAALTVRIDDAAQKLRVFRHVTERQNISETVAQRFQVQVDRQSSFVASEHDHNGQFGEISFHHIKQRKFAQFHALQPEYVAEIELNSEASCTFPFE